MKIRALHRLLAATVVGLFSLPAIAQYTKDASASQKIDEAINSHYLMMELDKAESALSGTVSACGDKCSPEVKARAWMYIGIVRGSGRSDMAGAKDAFAQAKALDPNVRLDADLASPETSSAFNSTAGGSQPSPTPAPSPSSGPAPGAAPPPPGVPGDMLCSPQGSAIGTNMPIPVSCSSNASVASVILKFIEPGGADWKKINLEENSGQWQGMIPCDFTKKSGDLKFYVGAKDSTGQYVDQFGSKKQPASFKIADGGVAPAYPGDVPVVACGGGAADDCPPDFPGCSQKQEAVCGDLDWGASCKNSSQCKCGLLCESGQCATAPTCSADSECDTGACVDGYCSALAETKGPEGPFQRHWLSLTAGMDLMPLGGNNLCSAGENFDVSYGIQCYNADGDRVTPDGVNVGTGIVPAQLRIKLGYDFAFTPHLALGIRAGIGILNSHPRATNRTNPEAAFLPLHLEGRATYTFTSLAKGGLRPALYVAGGIGESNARLVTQGGVELYKIAGRMFAAPGGTLGYMFAPNMGINADVQLMLLFPTGGMAMAIHPGLSFVYGL